MTYFLKKIICVEASACPVSIVTQNHSWNCDIFDDDVYDDDEKTNSLKTVGQLGNCLKIPFLERMPIPKRN